MNKIRILLTGGSGFIGTNVVDDFIKLNYDFINVDISKPKNADHNIFWKDISLTDKQSLKKIFKDYRPTHVLHLASILGGEGITSEKLNENIISMKNIVDLINESSSVESFLFASSLLVCKNGYIPENDTDYCPPNEYGRSKVQCEKILRSSNIKCKWNIVRPTAIWGPWFQESSKSFFKIIDRGLYFHIGNHNAKKSACYVGNASYMMNKILFSNQKIHKQTFYLADYPSYSIREWANCIQENLNLKPIVTIPQFVLKFLAIIGDFIEKILKIKFPLTTFRLNNMLIKVEYPVKNTIKLCGDLPFSLDSSVKQTIRWLSENKMIKNKLI